MGYNPIGGYGVIGNMRTAALVAMDGSIDWFCLPRLDSPSVFAAMLDDHKGGYFKIAPIAGEPELKQFYWPDTNVLVTRFLSDDGVGELTDFMPVGFVDGEHQDWLIRDVYAARGEVRFRMECRPAFNFARDAHEVIKATNGVCFRAPGLGLSLTSTVPIQIDANGAVAEFTLKEGQRAIFALSRMDKDAPCGRCFSAAEGYEMLKNTVAYWQRWLSHCTYQGRWREMVQRSALALKLMTYEPTGALIAAVTTSLPERVGGPRNWDYRYTWIRDSAFTLYALMRIGLVDEATRFMGWLEERCHELEPGKPLQIMYGIDGRHDLSELTLDHLDGYKSSRPVRIGNAAFGQRQLDIYGELLDAVYLYNKYGAPISSELWEHLSQLLAWVCDHWREPDAGIWEIRDGDRHFVYSKLMCWVALDRGLRLADKRSFPADRARWLKERDAIYVDIMAKGWSEKRRAFTQSYGSDALDASNLLMPLTFFLSANDPRMLATVDAITAPVDRGGLMSDSLLYRYDQGAGISGFGAEGSFNICTFWLVEALTRAGRTDPARLVQARLIFEKMLGYANHLELYAEETGSRGQALGNFPLAFTHLSLISAAFNLDRAFGAVK